MTMSAVIILFFILSPLNFHQLHYLHHTLNHPSPIRFSWLSSTFNTPHFSLFTTKDIINTSSHFPTISNSNIYPLYPTPEPSFIFCSGTFDGWFGISFKDTNCFTDIHSPHPFKISTLCGLCALTPLFHYILSSV